VFKNNLSKTELQFLENKAVQIRKDIINAIFKAGFTPSALELVEINALNIVSATDKIMTIIKEQAHVESPRTV
jgi:hypothetical protein